MLGIIHFSLPGMFPDNALPGVVNLQLWTVPFELRCYEVLIVIALVGAYRSKWLFVAAATAWALYVASQHCLLNCSSLGAMAGDQLVLCFLLGVGLFRFRDRVVWSSWLGALSAATYVGFAASPIGYSPATIPLAYLTVYLGLLNPPRIKFLFSGDYSYGIFLYGFPIQQAIASAGPWARTWWVSLLLTLPLTSAVAVASWWLIEKPVLNQRAALL